MRYENTPRPLIEDHYHIRELIENQEKRHDDRNYHREKGKLKEEREDLIKDARPFVVTDFWCNKCKVDFKSQAIKQIEKDWNADQNVAFYKAKCWKGHWNIRYITDKLHDPFFIKSKLLARERAKYANDIIQPFQTGYNTLYGKKNA